MLSTPYLGSHMRGSTTQLPRFSPLVLADSLLTLAQAEDHAGYRGSAERLIVLACAVLDDSPASAA
jgi:hypothetical protein